MVSGNSMNPTLKNNEILILKKYDKSFERFDIVVVKEENEKLIKRVIGLPGEFIEYRNNKLYINGKVVEDSFANVTDDFKLATKIPENTYFVMGDNRKNSLDSRVIGPVKLDKIQGSIGIRLFPFNRMGGIK